MQRVQSRLRDALLLAGAWALVAAGTPGSGGSTPRRRGDPPRTPSGIALPPVPGSKSPGQLPSSSVSWHSHTPPRHAAPRPCTCRTKASKADSGREVVLQPQTNEEFCDAGSSTAAANQTDTVVPAPDGYQPLAEDVRCQQAQLKFDVPDNVAEYASLQVLCTGGPNGSVAFGQSLDPANPGYVYILVRELAPGTDYQCHARFIVSDSASPCSSPIAFRTPPDRASRAPMNVTADRTLLWWNDDVNDFDTVYLVQATRKVSQPLCCEDRVDIFQFLTPSGRTCCEELRMALPTGNDYIIHVRPEQGGDEDLSTPITMYNAIGGVYPMSSLSVARPLTLDSPLEILVCPPCENFANITAFYVTPTTNCSPYASTFKRFPRTSLNQTDGYYTIPIVSDVNSTSWCAAAGQTFTVNVDVMPTPVRVSEISFTVPHICPTVPSASDMRAAVQVKAVPSSGAVVVFQKSLFNWGSIRPLSYAIVVSETGHENDLNGDCPFSDVIYSWDAVQNIYHTPSYRATPLGWNPFKDEITEVAEYTVGKDTGCKPGHFCNGPLRPATYTLRIRSYSQPGVYIETTPISFTVSALDDPDGFFSRFFIWTIAALITQAAAAAFFIAKYCYRSDAGRAADAADGAQLEQLASAAAAGVLSRNNSCRGLGVPPHGDPAVGVPPPYSRAEFKARAAGLPEDGVCPPLQREFEALCALSAGYSASTSSRVGHLPHNAYKNRYSNIVPFDRNRVRLRGCAKDDDIANYINASFIVGYSGRVEYIAAQGPKEETTRDFWCMVYEQDVRLVVMLTKLVECDRNKCHQYYPEMGQRFMWGDLAVQCSVQSELPAYTLRTIVMSKGSQQRLVHHLLFREWPDFGCPASSLHVLQFCMTVRRHAILFPGMVVVHCSAGVGRTGTLIAVDILLQSVKAGKKIDVFGVVMKLREQRQFMVQCQLQYFFIYTCLKAAVEKPPEKKSIPCPFPKANAFQLFKRSIQWK